MVSIVDGLGAIISLLLFFGLPVGFFVFIYLLSGIKVIMQYEKGIKFTLGHYSGLMHPGLNYVIPIFQSWIKVDTRVVTEDIPGQNVMTKDNIPVNINAVVYFRVVDPERAVLNVADYHYAISKYAQTSLRNVTGEVEMDELLTKRQEISKRLEKILDNAAKDWGLDVTMIELQDIDLPPQLKRVMARQAEAEREKRAIIIRAKGELQAAYNLAEAAKKFAISKPSLYLRTLETINKLSPEQSNTEIYAIPVEVLRMFEKLGGKGD